jgi:hypothetical protein
MAELLKAYMRERSCKAAEEGAERERVGVLSDEGDLWPQCPSDAQVISNRATNITDTCSQGWLAMPEDPCMASHGVYRTGYGRFLVAARSGQAFAENVANDMEEIFLAHESMGASRVEGLVTPPLHVHFKEFMHDFLVRCPPELHTSHHPTVAATTLHGVPNKHV